ncbi:sphingomyelin phosphodiesterase, partial [Streptomyces sp. ET3-23]|uniref:sphingomyelin phosphodiesterase n=1 Tax=Streptomyces sp. ET3-23 TaxID=2885643 RepID=UPI001D117377
DSGCHSLRGQPVNHLDAWKIISYNVAFALPRSGDENDANAHRARLIPAAGFLQDASLIVLQGLFETGSSLRLLRSLARHGFTHQVPVTGPSCAHTDPVSAGIAIVSRHTITRAEQHLYPRDPKADDSPQKGFTYAAVRAARNTLHIIGTHLHSGQDSTSRNIRSHQLARLADFLSDQEKNGTMPSEDMVVIAGTLNTAYGSSEHARALTALHADSPTMKLGWPYSFDTTNNTLARRHQADVPARSRGPAQDLDHILLRRGHAQPSRWNSRVLVSRTPWHFNTQHYTDYSDHQPVMAGAGVTTRPGRYDLILTAVRVTTRHAAHSDCPRPWGTITVTTDTSGPTTVWECGSSRSHGRRPGTNLLRHPLIFSSATAFAIQIDLFHNSPGPGTPLAYGTLWWQAGARLGRHIATVQGETGQTAVSFTTQLTPT